MARFNSNFGSQTTGVGTPTGFTDRWDTSVTYTIVDDASSKGGKYLKSVASASPTRTLLSYDAAEDADNVLGLIEINGATDNLPAVVIFGSGASGSENCYAAQLYPDTNTVELFEFNSGTPTSKGSYSISLNDLTKYWVRLWRSTEGDIRVRVWEDGTNEPFGSWQISSNDPTWVDGWCGFSHLANSGVEARLHYISAGTSGDTACEWENTDFPSDAYLVEVSDVETVVLRDTLSERDIVVGIYEEDEIIKSIRWHRDDGKLYILFSGNENLGIITTDIYGTNRTVIRAPLADLFGITFDYDNDLIYYTTRNGSASDLYKANKDGTSETLIVENVNSWLAAPHFDSVSGEILIPYNNAVSAWDSDGTLLRTYPTLTEPHAVVRKGDYLYAGRWRGAGLYRTPFDNSGGSWTTVDSTVNYVWYLELEENGDIVGCDNDAGEVYRWTGEPTELTRTLVWSDSDLVGAAHSVTSFEPAGGPDTEIIREYFPDEDVQRIDITASSTYLTGSGDAEARGWLITEADLPDYFHDTDHADYDAAIEGTLRFALNQNGYNQLDIDIEEWTAASGGGSIAIWISPGTFTGGSDLELWMFWINGGSQTQPTSSANAWGQSAKAIFNATTTPTGSAGDVPDSSSEGNDGQTFGTMGSLVSGPGRIKNAWDYVRSNNQYIQFGDFELGTQFRIEFWAHDDVGSTRMAYFGKNSASGANDFVFLAWENNQYATLLEDDYDDSGTTDQDEHHYAVIIDGTSVRGYQDGVLIFTHAKSSSSGTILGGKDFTWGAEYDGSVIGDWYDGLMAAKRLYDSIPSGNEAESILATYSSQKETDFWSLGTVQDGPFADTEPTIDTLNPYEGPIGTEVVLTGTNLTGTTEMDVNGIDVVTFTVDNDSQITFTVPDSASTGPIGLTAPGGSVTSAFDYTVLPTIPSDGWNIELFQIQVNSEETDIEQVDGTYKQYYTEGLTSQIDFIPTSISNLEESIEWDEGVFRLGSVDVSVVLLEDTYFNNYRDYVSSPFILLIRDADNRIIFHGPVDPETCNYNAKTKGTSFRALSWEVLLEGTSAPCRSIYETTFSREYAETAPGINSTFFVKAEIDGQDMTEVVVAGSVFVFDTPAGEYRSVVLAATVEDDDLRVLVNTEPTVYLASGEVVAGSAHSVFTVGSGGLTWRRLKITMNDTQIWENLNAAVDSNTEGGELLLSVDVNGKNYTMNLVKGLVSGATFGAWYILDEDRATFDIYFNICSGSCDPATLETDFIDFGSTITITSSTTVNAGDAVRILGAELYGYNNEGPAFAPVLPFDINGGVLQGMFSLSDLGVLPYIVDTFVFPTSFDKTMARWVELPPNLLEALHQMQNTHGLLTRITPTIGPSGLPRATVTVRDRADANATDAPVVTNLTNIIDWGETASDLTPTAVVVKSHVNYFEPVGRVEDVGFYFDGLDLLDPQTTGKPQNGRVVEITVNKTPSYDGEIFFGDGVPVRNDSALKAIAKKFYEYYRNLSRPCQFKIEGTPSEDLLTKILQISEIDDPLTETTFTRTVFCEGVITDLNTKQTVIRGRIGEFTGIGGSLPVPVVSGQLVYTDVDGSGGESIRLSGLNSYDPNGDTLSYEWFDGSLTSLSTSPILETSLSVGTHTIRLQVTDPDANSVYTEVSVKINEEPEDLPDGEVVQANFVVQTWSMNNEGDLFVSVTGDSNTKTTNGIKYRTADTQAGLDAASDTLVDNPQVNVEIISAIATNATKWARFTLINDVDDTDSTNVWEFSVVNIAATTALIIPSNTAPTGTADTAGVEGEIRQDDSYIYVKTSAGWKRSALSTF